MSLVSNELLPQLPQESRQQQSRAECADMSIYNEFVLKAVLLSDSRTELMAITDIYRACPIVYTSKCTHTVSVPHDESFWDNKPPFTHRTSWAGTSETDVPSRPGQAQPSPAQPSLSRPVLLRPVPSCSGLPEPDGVPVLSYDKLYVCTNLNCVNRLTSFYIRNICSGFGRTSRPTVHIKVDPSARFVAEQGNKFVFLCMILISAYH